jgi:multiple RNA-binding domain-containing protein 1
VKAHRQAKLEAAAFVELNAGQKRKRSEIDESDSKLKEFLEVMQPASKSKAWESQVDEEPPTKIQAIEIPEAESDGEYEAVPMKSKRQNSPRPSAPQEPSVINSEPTRTDETVEVGIAPNTTDDDWLRSRTNRLLDLMDPEDISMAQGSSGQVTEAMTDNSHQDVEGDKAPAVEDEALETDELDPIIEAIKSNGRLFVRNLPYTASKDDLTDYFAPYGSLEEVSSCVSFCQHSLCFMMNIQIGTAYASSM